MSNLIDKNKLFAHKCSITGEGMNKGFVLDGELYFKYEKDLLQHLKQLEKGFDKYMRFTDIWSLIEDYYNTGALSFEDWSNDKPQYVEINNKLTKL